ncbi:MAG: hypothetical protein V2I67_14265, partial [Thermoanaerobaculales bacterium]|nr:hypothetical protein [Thermoanaerobaculales bacterium]
WPQWLQLCRGRTPLGGMSQACSDWSRGKERRTKMANMMSDRSEVAVTETGQGTGASSQRRWLLFVVAALALALGILVGVVASNRAEDKLDVVRAGGGDLSGRQEEMVEIVEDYIDAWQATDGDQAASFMTDDGSIEYIGEGWVFSVEDRSLQARISNGPYTSLRVLEPMVVHDDRVVLTGEIDSLGLHWSSIIQFTTGGEVEIVSESIEHWE